MATSSPPPGSPPGLVYTTPDPNPGSGTGNGGGGLSLGVVLVVVGFTLLAPQWSRALAHFTVPHLTAPQHARDVPRHHHPHDTPTDPLAWGTLFPLIHGQQQQQQPSAPAAGDTGLTGAATSTVQVDGSGNVMDSKWPLGSALVLVARVCASMLVVGGVMAHTAASAPTSWRWAMAGAAGVSDPEVAKPASTTDKGQTPKKPSLMSRLLGRAEASPAPQSMDLTTTKSTSAITALSTTTAGEVIEEEETDAPRCRFRLRTWQLVVLVAAAVYLGSWALNTVIMSALAGHSDAIVLGQEQIEEVANALVDAEKQLRYDIIMGHTSKMNENELMAHLREVGLHLEEEERHNMLQGAANTITDLIVGFCFTLTVFLNKARVAEIMDKISKRFMGLSNTTQAFLLLLLSDVIVGYHSSDGWFTVLKLIGQHYGWSEKGYESIISIFVAIVPVGLDVAFKFWVFKELRRLSPSTQVILGEIDRH